MIPASVRIFVCTRPHDMRCSYDTLARPGLDAVELAAGEQGNEDRVDAGALVAAEEEPVLAAEDLAAQVLLGDVVVERQPAVVEESAEGGALVAGVAEGAGDGCLVQDGRGLLIAPGEECFGAETASHVPTKRWRRVPTPLRERKGMPLWSISSVSLTRCHVASHDASVWARH